MLAGMMARPAGDFVAHEFRRDEGRDRGAETLAIGESRFGAFAHQFAAEIFPRRDKNHFLRDDAGAGKFILGDADTIAALAAETYLLGRAARGGPARHHHYPLDGPPARRTCRALAGRQARVRESGQAPWTDRLKPRPRV